MSAIYLRNTTRKHRLLLRAVEREARALLEAVGEPTASLSVSFVGDSAIRRLNREHRGKDSATDVLSFPLLEPAVAKRGVRRPAEADVPGAPERLLGDVVISLDSAWRQACAYDATLQDEVARLLIHGLLHLLGHDHEEARERTRMVREERRLAAVLGVSWPYEA